MRVAIIGSTKGSNLIPLHELMRQHNTNINFCCVVTNKPRAKIVEKANYLNIPTVIIDSSLYEQDIFEQKLNDILEKNTISLVVLIGFMKILSPNFVRKWRGRIINTHPSLLPKYKGMMGNAIHQAVIKNKEKITGCTVHEVTEILDEGPILTQERYIVKNNDSWQTLKENIQKLEVECLCKAILQKQDHFTRKTEVIVNNGDLIEG